jgi:hypothetical protein
MAGAAHLGVALAAKRVAPRMPLWALVLSSYAIDVAFIGFALAGKEHMPRRAQPENKGAAGKVDSAAQRDSGCDDAGTPSEVARPVGTNPLSHGLAMAAVWTSLSILIAAAVSRDRRTTGTVGLLVFGHWLVDFISKPMTGVFPQDTGLPLGFEGSPTVGLGLYRSKRVANAVEYGSLAVGAALYLQTVASGRGRRTES